ncbi:hypothetical protein SDC9_73219 [bioreactor metagenome]|uniref:DUF4446 domain-containing protein n=1 Tax=bioreactor metagenome TaxID=1076179 RepID=A0A644YDU8_9ZZZZ|nr:DUF4446 family protein [Candidatus Metalachnospira sp.]
MTETSFFAQNLDLWMSIVLALLIVFVILVILDIYNNKKLKARYETFMGVGKKHKKDINMEKLLVDCVSKAESIDEKYGKILEIVEDVEKNMQFCCQKVGIVRYNPFEEMGGNLCFAVAILDAENTGIVINGIHSRTGTFTYAKPVELGVSTYILSKEEQEAIDKAKTNAYQAVKNTVAVTKPSKMLKAKKIKEKEQEVKEKVEIYKNAAVRTRRKKNNKPVVK